MVVSWEWSSSLYEDEDLIFLRSIWWRSSSKNYPDDFFCQLKDRLCHIDLREKGLRRWQAIFNYMEIISEIWLTKFYIMKMASSHFISGNWNPFQKWRLKCGKSRGNDRWKTVSKKIGNNFFKSQFSWFLSGNEAEQQLSRDQEVKNYRSRNTFYQG